MSNFVFNNCRIAGTHVTTTSSTTVYAVAANTYVQVLGIWLTNIAGADTTVTVEWGDDSAADSFALLAGYILSANDSLYLPPEDFPIQLDESDTLSVTAADANAVDVVVAVAEQNPRSR